MKLSKMGLLAALTLGGLVVCSNMATAQDAKDGQKKRGFSVEQQMERMNEQLKLTDAQKPKVKAALEESQKKMQEMRGDSSVPQDQRREKMRALMDEQDKKLKAILTTEQYDKWQKAREEMRGKRGGDKQDEGKKKA
jgi:Spy/CpxP family protein refolding chaperone